MHIEGSVGSGQLHLRDTVRCTKQAAGPAVGLCRDGRRREEGACRPTCRSRHTGLQTACSAQDLRSWSRTAVFKGPRYHRDCKEYDLLGGDGTAPRLALGGWGEDRPSLISSAQRCPAAGTLLPCYPPGLHQQR